MEINLSRQRRNNVNVIDAVYEIEALYRRAKKLKDDLPPRLFDPRFGTPEKYVFAVVYLKQLDHLFAIVQEDISQLQTLPNQAETSNLTGGFVSRAQKLSGICGEILGDFQENTELLALIQIKYKADLEPARIIAEQAAESIRIYSQVLSLSVDDLVAAAKSDLRHLLNLLEMFVVAIERSTDVT